MIVENNQYEVIEVQLVEGSNVTYQAIGSALAGVAVGSVGSWFVGKYFGKKKREKLLLELTKKVIKLEGREKQEDQALDILAVKSFMIEEIFGEKSKLTRKEKGEWQRILNRFVMIDTNFSKQVR
jgi:hypothetical protein